MNQGTDRIPCPHCQANNFLSSIVCWQCGRPLRAQESRQPTEPTTEIPPQAGTPRYNQADYRQPPMNRPPHVGYQQPPIYQPPPRTDDTQTHVILGFVSAVVGLFCCPIVFGAVAIVLGIIARNRGNPMGVWVIVAGVASVIIGGLIGAMIGILGYLQEYAPM